MAPSSVVCLFLLDGALRADPGQARRHRPADAPQRPGHGLGSVPTGAIRRRQPAAPVRGRAADRPRRPLAARVRRDPVDVHRHLRDASSASSSARFSASSAATWAVGRLRHRPRHGPGPRLPAAAHAAGPLAGADRPDHRHGRAAGQPVGRGLPHRRARVLRLAVLRPDHPRPGALAARARVHRGPKSLRREAPRIWFTELLPNLWAPILVYTTLILPTNVSAEAALSFLGVGVKAPTPTLGNILTDSVNFLQPDPTVLPPARAVHLRLRPRLQPAGRRSARRAGPEGRPHLGRPHPRPAATAAGRTTGAMPVRLHKESA